MEGLQISSGNGDALTESQRLTEARVIAIHEGKKEGVSSPRKCINTVPPHVPYRKLRCPIVDRSSIGKRPPAITLSEDTDDFECGNHRNAGNNAKAIVRAEHRSAH